MSRAERLLLIDAGNTRVKWAVWTTSACAWSQYGAAETRAVTLDSAAAAGLASMFASVGQVVVSNVAGAEVEMALRSMAGPVPMQMIRSTANCAGVRNQYDDPAQLGTDRFAALIGAHAIADLVGKAKLVVVAGTAVTIDALTSDSVFLGGAILPGPDMMRRALHGETAQLPLGGASAMPDEFARSTTDAIAAGVSEAVAGAVVLGAQRLARHSTPREGMCLVVSGGAAAGLLEALASCAPSLAATITMCEHLVLDGLRLIVEAGHPPD